LKKGLCLFLIGFLFLSGCGNQAVPEKKEADNSKKHSEITVDSPLKGELAIDGIELGSTYIETVEALGSPIKETGTELSNLIQLHYDGYSLFKKDSKIVGVSIDHDDIQTASGISIGDTISKLKNIDTLSIHTLENTYYLYDDHYILLFEVNPDSQTISRIELYERDTYLSWKNLTLEELLLASEQYEIPATAAEDSGDNGSTEQDQDSSEPSQNTNENRNKKPNKPAEKGKEDTESDNESYADPFQQTNGIAAFSKTVQIGDNEEKVRDFLGEGYINGNDSSETIYDHPPFRFIAQKGVITYISWGRSGTFEDWETKEGIGRGSTIEQAKKAYASFDYDLYYKKGLALPSYMIIEYPDGLLILEISNGMVSLIIRCTPEKLDDGFVPFEEMEDHPF
jgi:hypothetical protein